MKLGLSMLTEWMTLFYKAVILTNKKLYLVPGCQKYFQFLGTPTAFQLPVCWDKDLSCIFSYIAFLTSLVS